MIQALTRTTSPPQPPAAPLRPATKLALEIMGQETLSWSGINLMRSCPQKFFFHYVERARPDFVPSALLFGGAIHSALEYFLRAQMEGLTAELGELVEVFHQAWMERQHGDQVPVRFNKNEDENSVHQMADRMLRAYLESPLSHLDGELIAVEEQLRQTLDPELPDLLSRVDLIWHGHDQSLHLADFKTSRSRWNQQKAAESSEQLLLYRQMARSMAADLGLPMQLHFIVLTKAKTPVVEMLDLPECDHQLDQIKTTFKQVFSAITAGNFYPTPSPQNCNTCPYKSRCPAFGR